MKEISYVHDGVEVMLTGRIATKELKARRNQESTTDELVEITPKDDETGSWKKFVRMKELYTLSDGEEK
jgi:hypothetical protein